MAVAAPAVVNIVGAYNTRVAAARRRVVDALTRAWGSLDNYRAADIDRFVRQVVPLVEGAQLQVATLTDAYLAQIEAQVLGKTVRPIGVPARAVSNATMRGVSTAEVYRRAGPTVWTSLSRGQSLDNAVRAGLARMQRTAETDVQLSRTHASRYVLSRKSNVVGYRRVLTGGHSCALCAVASTQRYHKAELSPLHPGCSCGILPVFGDKDPGQVVDPERLASVKASLQERFGHDDARRSTSTGGRATKATDFDDARQLVVVHEHGELGPVLTRRSDHWTGPDDI